MGKDRIFCLGFHFFPEGNTLQPIDDKKDAHLVLQTTHQWSQDHFVSQVTRSHLLHCEGDRQLRRSESSDHEQYCQPKKKTEARFQFEERNGMGGGGGGGGGENSRKLKAGPP